MNLTKRCIAEFLGTFWLVIGGCGSAVLAAAYTETNAQGVSQLGIGTIGVSFAFGLTVLTMAYASDVTHHQRTLRMMGASCNGGRGTRPARYSRFNGWVSPKLPRADEMSPTSCNARFKILTAAFSSRSILSPHFGHSWRRTDNVFGTFTPQLEQF